MPLSQNSIGLLNYSSSCRTKCTTCTFRYMYCHMMYYAVARQEQEVRKATLGMDNSSYECNRPSRSPTILARYVVVCGGPCNPLSVTSLKNIGELKRFRYLKRATPKSMQVVDEGSLFCFGQFLGSRGTYLAIRYVAHPCFLCYWKKNNVSDSAAPLW